MIAKIYLVLRLLLPILYHQGDAQDCNDPPWCEYVEDGLCESTKFVPDQCKTMCKTCRKEIHCPDFGPLSHGKKTTSSGPPYSVGTVAIFNCDTGYKASGFTSSICLDNGTWSGATPQCRKIYCPDIEPVSHGDTTTSVGPPYPVGTVVNINCDTGYKAIGRASIKCLDNGVWSDETPQCIITSCKRDLTKLESGGSCRKKCKHDVDCKGKLKTCQCDGWCGRSCFNPYAECPVVSKPQNGFTTSSGTQYGATVIYSCKKGYELVGPSKRTCRSNREWSEYPPYCVPFSSCAKSVRDEKRSKVVGGTDAKLGDWPWQAIVMKSANYSVLQMYRRESLVGGGSVINEEWVLSAAHVIEEALGKDRRKRFHIVVGANAFVKHEELEIPDPIQIYDYAEVYLHPQYDEKSFDYDVALIRIGERLKRGANNRFIVDYSVPRGKLIFTQFVRPVCLPCMKGDILQPTNILDNFVKQRCSQEAKSIFHSFAPTGSSVVVTGFGLVNLSTFDLPENLQEGILTIVDDLECVSHAREIKAKVKDTRYTKRMFCASGGTEDNMIDSCQGDSGGPVVKQMQYRNQKQVKFWVQLGIVSWGLGCADKHHGFYVSVPSIMSWIWKTLDDAKRGVWGAWSPWRPCSVSCGNGIQTKSRRCHGPGKCKGPTNEMQTCKVPICIESRAWSACSETCEGGKQTRTKSNGAKETRDCNTQRCDSWSECDKPCGGGKKRRTNCLWVDICGTVIQECNTQPCD